MFFHKSCVCLRKKSPRQGCTKPKTELGMHQNPYFHQNPLKINENPKINPPSTIIIPESGLYISQIGDISRTVFSLSLIHI